MRIFLSAFKLSRLFVLILLFPTEKRKLPGDGPEQSIHTPTRETHQLGATGVAQSALSFVCFLKPKVKRHFICSPRLQNIKGHLPCLENADGGNKCQLGGQHGQRVSHTVDTYLTVFLQRVLGGRFNAIEINLCIASLFRDQSS